MTRLSIGIVASLLVAGCSLAPTYERPASAVPPSWPVGDAYLKHTEAGLPTIGYRDLFHDPTLQSLIGQAIANNQDLRAALANVDAARGQLQAQRALLLPQIAAGAGATTGKSGLAASSTGVVTTSERRTSYDANVGLSAFEIDLFGRVRSLSDAALQAYLGTEAAVRTARLTLVAQVATTYLTIAADRSLLAIARETEVTASRSVELTRARLSGGVAPRSDVRQAETVLAQARSDLAAQTTLVAQDRNALELLVGAPVADADLPASIESVDGLLDALPAGLDSRVLLRRPDVLQAEYTLRAANARIGAARAAFFPTISLTAVAGFASNALSTLVAANGFAWSIGPAISLPLFDAGLREGNLVVAEAARDAAVAAYQKAIQSSFREVADALARRGTIADQFKAQADLEAAARDSYFLADARYREGVDTFLTSLDAQRTLYTARRALATTRLTRAANLVQLYRVIGGTTD
ncbi:MAG: efflux transporter outer membrane subunit [Burkholderiaceae bacterium]